MKAKVRVDVRRKREGGRKEDMEGIMRWERGSGGVRRKRWREGDMRREGGKEERSN